MIRDRQGNPLQGASAEAGNYYDRAVEAFNLYTGDPVALVDRAIEISPEFALAQVAKGWLFALATEPAATAAARDIAGSVTRGDLDPRAASLLVALDTLLGGNWTSAARRLDLHNAEYPHDLLAIQAGHLVDFYRAGSRSLRDRLARVLPQWSTTTPGYPVLLGMYAFGLEETGAYTAAEETGRRALDLEPRDCWAHHAVAHVMEMQGRAQDGIGWMIAREPDWSGEDNAFRVHNWWHRALWHLDLGQLDEALALYDGPIRERRSNVALDLVDAAALLWRVELCGGSVGDRWHELAGAWLQQADGNYPFNDWHAAMSAIGAERPDALERIRRALADEATGMSEAGDWAREVGLPLVEGFAAFRRGDYTRTVDCLVGAGQVANRFGGSHAQRDLIDWTLTEAAARGGMTGLARALGNERLAMKPHSPANRAFLARLSEPAAQAQR